MRRTAPLIVVALLALGAGAAHAQEAVPVDPNAPPVEPAPDPTVPLTELRPTPKRSYTARLVTQAGVHKVPDGVRSRVLKPWIPSTGNPVELLVLDARLAPNGETWLKVLLPTRPNGSSGWIRESLTILRENPTRVEISLRKATMRVLRAGRVIYRTGVALGAPATPTPRGRFAVYQEVREPGWSPLGPWALHLTAHSNVLFEYAGGPGRVAIHGARGALWAEPGQYISHGCIRVPDPRIAKVAGLVTPGTPVDIVR